MTRLAFTPGEGGGKPAKPKPLFPWLEPQPRPEPEPDVTSVTPMVNIISSNPPPPVQQTSVKPRPATTRPGPVVLPPDILDINPDAVGSREQQIAALNSGQSPSGFPQDIDWDPDISALGLVTFIQTAAEETRDSSENKTIAVCEALYNANPEGAESCLKIMTGVVPDDGKQLTLEQLVNLARSVGLVNGFDSKPWNATKLGPLESSAESAAEEEPMFDQAQAPAKAGNPELNRRLRYSLTEGDPGEWNASLTEKEDLENVLLIPKLKRFIHGFDENSVNWDEFTLQESIEFYIRQIGGVLKALSENPTLSDEYFQEIQEEYDWAAELLALAKPIPLDDTAAYTEVFDVGAEGERAHVQKQLAVIYEYLDITPADNHLESRNTTDLKYELYSLLIYHVIPLRGSDQDPLAAQLFRSYTKVAGVSPQAAVDRLQGTYREPDVLGFLFVMGLTMFFEPLDYVLTAVDVIQALSERDFESAVGNFILGVTPFASSRMDDAFRLLDDLGAARLGGPLDNIPKYFANPVGKGRPAGLPSRNVLKGRGFNDEMIEIFEYRGGTGPGIGKAKHSVLEGLGPIDTLEKGKSIGVIKQNENFEILRDQYEYNIVHRPNPDQLKEVQYDKRTNASGRPINSGNRMPDYIIEGRAFDAYTVGSPKRIRSAKDALGSIWNMLPRKVPGQTDRLVIDLSFTNLTPDELGEYLSGLYAKGDPHVAELKEVYVMKDNNLVGMWVQPKV